MTQRLRTLPFLLFALMLLPILYLAMSLSTAAITWDLGQYYPANSSNRLTCAIYAGALPFSSNPPQWFTRTYLLPARINEQFLDVETGFQHLADFVVMRDISFLSGAGGGGSVVWIVLLGSMAACVPIGFLAIPISRRRVKVNVHHLVRITAYSTAPIVVVVLISWNVRLLQFARIPYDERFVVHTSLIWFPMFLVVWWTIAIRHYLKMEHAFGTAVAMTVFAVSFTWLVVAISCLVLN